MLTPKIGWICKCEHTVATVHSELGVLAAARVMRQKRSDCLVVTDSEGKPMGLITRRDVVQQVMASGRLTSGVRVRTVMNRVFWPAKLDMSLDRAQELMKEQKLDALPIVDGDKPIGLVSSQQITAALGRAHQLLVQLEEVHPGITHIRKTGSGRIIIGD